MNNRYVRLWVMVLIISLLWANHLARPAYAAGLVVNSLADNTADDTSCTLREAILAANNAPANTNCGAGSNDNDTITFSVSGTITLGSTLPTIVSGQGALTIDGGGNITISGNNTVRVFVVDSAASLALQNLTVANGRASDGGGILNAGTLTITNSTFSDNWAVNSGGGILNAGTLTITNSTLEGNTANGSTGYGGGIANFGGTLTLTNSTLANNIAVYGAGIFNIGTLTITNSTLANNIAEFGGGIYNDFGGTLTLTNSTLANNMVVHDGGGIVNDFGGTLTITNSTLANNIAEFGGGIRNTGGTLTITNSTLSDNSANYSGGGIYNYSGIMALANTIVANSTGGDCVQGDAGTIRTSSNNLIETGGCGLTNGASGNIIGQDPNLSTLTGSPAYFPLSASSPAIDAGNEDVCAAAPVNNQSQNGVTRPQDGNGDTTAVCDIGAYEYDRLPPTVVSITRAGANPTNAASVSFIVTFSKDVTGVDSADFSLSTTGSIAGASVGSVSGTGTTYTVSVATGTGSGTLRLDLNASGTGIQDPLGNPISGGFTTGEEYTVDKIAPTVVSITRAGANPTNAASVSFIVTFSKDVTGVDSADFSLSTTGSIAGASVGSVSGTGTTYTVSVATGTGSGTVRLDIPATASITDATGNGLSALPYTSGESYTVDKTALTVTINQAATQSDLASSGPIRFMVVFSKPINLATFTTSDVILGGTAPGTLTVTLLEITPHDGTTFEVSVSGMTGNGTVTATIPAGVVQDMTDSLNSASTSTDNEVTYQTDFRIHLPLVMR